MMEKYKIKKVYGKVYQVLELTRNKVYDEDDWEDQDSPEYFYEVVSMGSLSDCKAYIKLNTKGD